MNKTERVTKDPLSLRFEDCGELYRTWNKVQKVVVFVLVPLIAIPILVYTCLCEIEYFFK